MAPLPLTSPAAACLLSAPWHPPSIPGPPRAAPVKVSEPKGRLAGGVPAKGPFLLGVRLGGRLAAGFRRDNRAAVSWYAGQAKALQSLSPEEGEGENDIFVRARSSLQQRFEEEMTTSCKKRKEKGT